MGRGKRRLQTDVSLNRLCGALLLPEGPWQRRPDPGPAVVASAFTSTGSKDDLPTALCHNPEPSRADLEPSLECWNHVLDVDSSLIYSKMIKCVFAGVAATPEQPRGFSLPKSLQRTWDIHTRLS